MKLIDNTPHLFTPEQAEKTAKEMQENDLDDWKYIVKHDPKGTGYSLIEVYDENGEFIERL